MNFDILNNHITDPFSGIINQDYTQSQYQQFSVSNTAATQLQRIFLQQNSVSKLLRIKMTGGGCAGYQQNFSLADTLNNNDFCFAIDSNDNNAGSIVIDPDSMVILNHAELDYCQELIGSFFKINHPEAKSKCGCGTSFSF